MSIRLIQSNIKLFLIIVLLLITHRVDANSVIMYATTDSTAILQGRQTSIKLEVVQDKDAKVKVVMPQKHWTPTIEVIRTSRADTTNINNNRIKINRNIIITSFDEGDHKIPSIISILDNDTFKTEPLFLKVIPVQIEGDSIDIKPLKENLKEPRFVLFDYIPWYAWVILAILILIGIGIFIYFKYFKNRAKKVVVFVPQIPPHIKALNALAQLKEEKLWQGGYEKEYYTRLIDILREYIDSRFSINAMEMTTTEIIDSLRSNKESKSVEKNIRKILEIADFVKFAKMRPLPDDNQMAMENAINFVENTIPQEESINKGKGTEKE